MKKILGLLGLLVLLAACAHKMESTRDPSSTKGLLTDIQKFQGELLAPGIFTEDTCEIFLSAKITQVLLRPAAEYLPQTQAEHRLLLQSTPDIMQEIFNLQMGALAKFKNFGVEKVSWGCRDSMNKLMRYGRNLSEVLGEWYVKHTKYQSQKFDLSHKSEQLFVNTAHQSDLSLQSGDIFLISNQHPVLSFLSRLGDDEGQFSAVALVYQDAHGKQYVLESSVESGAVITPWEEWRGQDFTRVVLLRHHNPTLAALAASKLYAAISSTVSSSTKHIGFDFLLDDKDVSALSSAELVQYAFALAADGGDLLPTYRTSLLSLNNHPILSDLSIASEDYFSPNDLEIDPHFQYLAEWKNFDTFVTSRTHEAVWAKMLDWITTSKYELDDPIDDWIKNYLAFWGRKLLGLQKDQMTSNLTANYLVQMANLNKIFQTLENYLQQYNLVQQGRTGRSLTYQEMREVLEKLREDDCQLYQKMAKNFLQEMQEHKVSNQLPLFHFRMNPKNRQCN